MVKELRAHDWDFPGIEHGFAPRDTPVAEHRRVVRVRQVHGADILRVDGKTPTDAGEADGLVTAAGAVAVAVATADCVPLLLVAPKRRVVAAVHAGWRGTLAGIVPAAVNVLDEHYDVAAEEIQAALGPSIGGCCFEIEREIAERFAEAFGRDVWEAWCDGEAGKGTLDLRRVNTQLLERSGIPAASIQSVGPCTFCGGADFASYRAQGADAGRQLSWIGLTP